MTLLLALLLAQSGIEESAVRDGLPNVAAKLRGGRDVRIAYLGGSITAGDGWRPKTTRWFRDQFPGARIEETNAGVGGTGSDLGVFRFRRDVLAHGPDLVFVEFAVNDSQTSEDRILKAMEGIVRQARAHDASLDLCFVYTIKTEMLADLQSGRLPKSAAAMERVAAHYGVPSIHLGLEVSRRVTAGTVVFAGPKPGPEGKILFSTDGVHPSAEGHALYAAAVARSMESLLRTGQAGPRGPVEPLRADHWEKAKMLPIAPSMTAGHWTPLEPSSHKLAQWFKRDLFQLWKGEGAGDRLTVRFRGTALGIYHVVGPECGQLLVTLDDQPSRQNALFDPFCTGYRLNKLMLEGLPDAVHTLRVEIHPEAPDKKEILGKAGNTMDDPRRFEGTVWYPGALLLLGDLVED